MEELHSTRSVLEEVLREHSSLYVMLSTLFLVLFVYCWNLRGFKLKSLPPGPMGLPIVGYLPFLGKHPHKTLNNLSKKYGNVFSLKIGQRYVVVCNDWESKKDAFNKTAMLNRPPRLFDAVPNGFGIVGNNGSDWSEQRRFCVRIMKDLGFGRPVWEEIVQAEVREAVSIVLENKDHAVNVVELFSQCFTGSLMGLVFGCHFPAKHPTSRYVSERMTTIMKSLPAMAFRNYSPDLCSVLTQLGVYGSHEAITKSTEFAGLVEKIVEEQLREGEGGNPNSFTKMYFQEVENNQKQNLNNCFTMSTLLGNAQALLVGGIDTTTDTTTWLLSAMADHQEVQSKVQQELDEVVGREGEVTWSMRAKIPYTMACLYEGLRWKTLTPINPLRMAMEDTKILEFDVPKGAIIVANNWALHNDPRYWRDPEKFDPERFLEDGGKRVNTKMESFSPFSQGRRNCPGEQMAILDILLFFASLVQKFRILPEDDHRSVERESVLGLTFKPVNMKLRFVSR